MQTRSPRSILAISAALALTAAALAPTAAFAKGPGPGAADCDGDCSNDQPQVQQQDGTGDGAQSRTRARDGSAQQTETQANAGGGQQVQARAGGGNTNGEGNTQARGNGKGNAEAPKGQGAQAGSGRGWDEDTPRGPGNCEDCDVEMGELTEIDIAGLVYMAEEEKLAHDVYVTFAELYDLRTFERIALSEARHQEAVRTVLDRYGITDPSADRGVGEFENSELQVLYDELIAKGSLSLEDALAAALEIEVVDIADLEARIAGLDQTAPDVFNTYSHLLTASRQHQAAFEHQL